MNSSDGAIIPEVDLSAYTLDVKYSLVNCNQDFTPPDIFLEPVTVDIEANNIINVDGLGQHFIAFYEPGLHKIYNLTLQKVEQTFE